MGIFEDILSKAEEADRSILGKYPALKASLDELETVKATLTEKDGLLTKATEENSSLTSVVNSWNTWRENNWDGTLKMTKGQIAAQKERDAARTELETLRAKGDTDMTFAEIEKELGGRFATKEDIGKIMTERNLVDAKILDDRMASLDQGMTYIYATTAPMLVAHDKEFGETFDLTGLFKFMNTNKIADPKVAYDQMVAPRRNEMQTGAAAKKAAEFEALKVENEAAVKKAVADTEDRVRRELGGASSDLPVEDGFGASGISLTRPGGETPPDGLKIDYSLPENQLGNGGIAAKIAAEIRNKRAA